MSKPAWTARALIAERDMGRDASGRPVVVRYFVKTWGDGSRCLDAMKYVELTDGQGRKRWVHWRGQRLQVPLARADRDILALVRMDVLVCADCGHPIQRSPFSSDDAPAWQYGRHWALAEPGCYFGDCQCTSARPHEAVLEVIERHAGRVGGTSPWNPVSVSQNRGLSDTGAGDDAREPVPRPPGE